MSRLIGITGATGHVGGALARGLRSQGVAARVIGRSAERLRELATLGAEPHVGSMDDVAFLTKALTGTDAVFVMIPPDYAVPDLRAEQRRIADRLATALERARVPRAVSLSSLGAESGGGNGPIAGLHDFEKRLEAVPGLQVLHLRPGYFMENHLMSLGLIKAQGINGSPLKADASMVMVATRDVGAAAAEILATPAFEGHGVRELLGPRDYTMREATRALGAAIGRPDLPYVEFPDEDARQAMVASGLSPDAARAIVEMYDAFNNGRIRPIQGRTPETTTPTTLEQFARDTFAPAFGA